MAVYYNKAIFDEYGVAYPEAGWTWDDLLATAQELTVDTDGDGQTDIWGIQLPGPWTTGFEYWIGAAGGSLISEDGTTFSGYMDSPETAAAVQFYKDLYNTYSVAPPPADMSAFGGGNSEFDNGTAAMRIFGRWPQAGMLENPNIDLGRRRHACRRGRCQCALLGRFRHLQRHGAPGSGLEVPQVLCR